MENIELMGECPSPNVTVNLPWAFDELLRIGVSPASVAGIFLH